MRKDRCQRLRHDIGKLVFRNPVPDTEKEMTTRLEDPARLLVTLNLVGKEHHAELADHGIEASILERQRHGIGLSPRDPTIMRLPRLRMIEHRRIEIGGDDARVGRKPRCDRACKNSGSGGRLQHVARAGLGQSLGEVARIGLEDEGNQEPIVDFRDRSREQLVRRHHRGLLRQMAQTARHGTIGADRSPT